MATKKTTPFYTELGNMLNMVRRISVELNEEMKVKDGDKVNLFTIWYSKGSSFTKLQERLIGLENEITYFFTEAGRRKAIDNTFNTQAFREKFLKAFKSLSSDYLAIKPGAATNSSSQATDLV
jgi:hypothetical protein